MSVRARILLLVLAASLLPLLAMLWLLFDYRANTVEQVRAQLALKTERLASELSDRISGTGQLLFGLARVPLVDGGDRETCSRFLAEVLQEHPQYTGLLTIDARGDLNCDSLQTRRALNVSDRDYFRRAQDSAQLIIEPAIGRLSGKPVLQIAYPVHGSDGKFRYLILASMDMATYGHQVASTLPYARGNFHLWSPDGKIVMDNPAAEARVGPASQQDQEFMLSQDERSTRLLGRGDDAHIWSKARVKHNNQTLLILAVSVPADELQLATQQRFTRAMYILLGLGGLTVLAATLLGEFSIRKQADRVIKAVAALDSGDYRSRIGGPYPSGEVGQVMQAIDRLANSLLLQQQEIFLNTTTLEQQARVDGLTGLANRHWLIQRLHLAVAEARSSGLHVGVLMLDLDRFKMVNDSLGHSQGDRLLVEAASRLRTCVREADTVARFGGDEFVILYANLHAPEDIQPLAQRVLTALAEPLESDGRTLAVNSSIGIAVYPQDSEAPEELLQHADTAMYRAKARGGNALSYFSQDMRDALLRRVHTEAGLRRALQEGEFCLHYQPIIAAQSGRVVSTEALIRWQDPERGLVSPGDFIPIAEETGLIIPIGHWVMKEAMMQVRRWHDQGLDLSVAINLSARQFNMPSLDETVAGLLHETGCQANRVQFEITESLIMEQVDHALAMMHRLTELGVQLMVDDFGTGYSSLSQLKRFPVSTLKIDASFVRDIEHDPNDEVLVDAIVALAKKLGLRTVAEGVENEAQVRYLDSVGCDRFQGYYFARPAPAEAVLAFMCERGEYQPPV